jgi:anti-sigma factor RsiW
MTPRDIACRELVELVTEYLEGALPPDEVAAIDRHLAECDPCLRYLRQMRATGRALSLLPTEQVSETLSDEAVDTLLAAFRRRPTAR